MVPMGGLSKMSGERSWMDSMDEDNPNVEARRRGMNVYDFEKDVRRKGDEDEIRKYFGNPDESGGER